MAESKITLQHLHGDVYEDVTGGLEPLFERCVEHGQVLFLHQSGYGWLPESRVTIAGVPPSDGGQQG